MTLRIPVMAAALVFLGPTAVGRSGAQSASTDPESTKVTLQSARSVLEGLVRSGLADCPTMKDGRFRRAVRRWTRSGQGAPVTWLPYDIIRSLGAELGTDVLPISGSNSRALFYLAFPASPTFEAAEKTRILEIAPQGLPLDNAGGEALSQDDLNFFFLRKGDPRYQLTTISGALNAVEEEFLYGNTSRLMFRSSCLLSTRALIEAGVSIPVSTLSSTLDAAARSSRSTVMIYGTFQSPLWFMLAGQKGPAVELDTLISIYELQKAATQDKRAIPERFVTNFSGWLILDTTGREIVGSATLQAKTGLSAGIVSVSASGQTTLQAGENFLIESYKLLIEPRTIQFSRLPTPATIEQQIATSLDTSAKAAREGDTRSASVHLANVSERLCSRVGSYRAYAYDASTQVSIDNDAGKPGRPQPGMGATPNVTVGPTTYSKDVCEVPVTLKGVEASVGQISVLIPLTSKGSLVWELVVE